MGVASFYTKQKIPSLLYFSTLQKSEKLWRRSKVIYETIFPHIKFYLIFSFLLVKILQPFLRFSNFPLLWSRAPQCHQLDYRTSSFCYFIQQYQVHTQSWWEKCTHQLCFVNCIINACVKWCNNSLKRRHISSQRQKEFYLRRKWLLEFFLKATPLCS